MRKMSVFLILFVSLCSFADEAYQTKNILGDWSTWDDTIFRNYGIRITEENGTVKLRYCELHKLRFEDECKEASKYTGEIAYSEANDSLLVKEDAGSQTPEYSIKIDEENPDQFLRDWGRQKLLYLRMK